MEDRVPEFLAIGHITLDKVEGGYLPGGTAIYSALTAHRLGWRTAVLTSGAPPEADVLRQQGIQIRSVPSNSTTIFENIYGGGGRTQFVRSVACVIHPSDVPPAWRSAGTVHLGPVAQEVDPLLVDQFDGALIGVTPQGWMRSWDGTGRVWFRQWASAEQILQKAKVLVFSEHDVQGDAALLEQYAGMAKTAVVTRGARGCDLHVAGKVRHLRAYPTDEVDPTGAGDVFAAAFFLYMRQHDDALEAANFANCVASFSVEAPGATGIPSKEQVEARYRPL